MGVIRIVKHYQSYNIVQNAYYLSCPNQINVKDLVREVPCELPRNFECS